MRSQLSRTCLIIVLIVLASCGKKQDQGNLSKADQYVIPELATDTTIFHLEKRVEEKDMLQTSPSGYMLSMDWRVNKYPNRYEVEIIDVQFIHKVVIATVMYDTSEDSVLVTSDFSNMKFEEDKGNEVNKVLENLKQIKGYNFVVKILSDQSLQIQLPEFPVSKDIYTYRFNPYSRLEEDLNTKYLEQVFELIFEHPTGHFEKNERWKAATSGDSIQYDLVRNMTHDALLLRGRSGKLDLQVAVDPDTGNIVEALLTETTKYKKPGTGDKIYDRIEITKSVETLVSNASLDSTQLIAYLPTQDSTIVDQ